MCSIQRHHEVVSLGESNNADSDRAISWDSGIQVVARSWPQPVAIWWFETEKGTSFMGEFQASKET